MYIVLQLSAVFKPQLGLSCGGFICFTLVLAQIATANVETSDEKDQ